MVATGAGPEALGLARLASHNRNSPDNQEPHGVEDGGPHYRLLMVGGGVGSSFSVFLGDAGSMWPN